MIEQIKQLRLEIDGLAQLCEGLKPLSSVIGDIDVYLENNKTIIPVEIENSEEIKEAVKSLKLSKAWLGKVLESLGSENPYGSGYKTVEDIVPETDVNKGFLHEPEDDEKPWLSKSHIERVDWLRTEVKSTLLKLHTIEQLNCDIDASDFTRVVEQHLTEARFWLGFELGRIRDESK